MEGGWITIGGYEFQGGFFRQTMADLGNPLLGAVRQDFHLALL